VPVSGNGPSGSAVERAKRHSPDHREQKRPDSSVPSGALPIAFVLARVAVAPRRPEDSHTPIERFDPAGGPEGGKQAGPKRGGHDDFGDS
jgi:hypothetical protein